ncbi:MAG: hypothetical protein LBK99_24430 [Opitutaceae bacterium]|jgi:hypothetical protein|nr:hypothetical protein [Opitutaceae bacterium]
MTPPAATPIPPPLLRASLAPTALLATLLTIPIPGDARLHANTATTANSATAPGLEKLHREALQSLTDSQANNPALFDLVQQRNAASAKNFLANPLADLDLTRIVGRPYSDYDRSAWTLPGVAYALFNAGLCHAQPGNPLHRDPAVLAKSEAAFEWILRQTSPEGTLGAPDGNIDRFTYAPAWEAFVLLGPDLPPPLRERFARHLLRAAEYQLENYGKNKNSPIGRYPNMDTAFILIMQQAARLFDRAGFAEDADAGLDQLARCLSGSTWLYLITAEGTKWNPSPGYTQIALQYLGRAWQLGQNPKALLQIQRHADYYRHYIEPGGQMDYGSAPHIKHDWALPWSDSIPGLELVRRYAPSPDPVLQTLADRAHAALRRSSGRGGEGKACTHAG